MDMVDLVCVILATAHNEFDHGSGQIRIGTHRLMGQSTVEYALVGALVVIAAAGAMSLLGSEITTVFTKITTALSGH
jgi:Flp pilus assembly pilin Flp